MLEEVAEYLEQALEIEHKLVTVSHLCAAYGLSPQDAASALKEYVALRSPNEETKLTAWYLIAGHKLDSQGRCFELVNEADVEAVRKLYALPTRSSLYGLHCGEGGGVGQSVRSLWAYSRPLAPAGRRPRITPSPDDVGSCRSAQKLQQPVKGTTPVKKPAVLEAAVQSVKPAVQCLAADSLKAKELCMSDAHESKATGIVAGAKKEGAPTAKPRGAPSAAAANFFQTRPSAAAKATGATSSVPATDARKPTQKSLFSMVSAPREDAAAIASNDSRAAGTGGLAESKSQSSSSKSSQSSRSASSQKYMSHSKGDPKSIASSVALADTDDAMDCASSSEAEATKEKCDAAENGSPSADTELGDCVVPATPSTLSSDEEGQILSNKQHKASSCKGDARKSKKRRQSRVLSDSDQDVGGEQENITEELSPLPSKKGRTQKSKMERKSRVLPDDDGVQSTDESIRQKSPPLLNKKGTTQESKERKSPTLSHDGASDSKEESIRAISPPQPDKRGAAQKSKEKRSHALSDGVDVNSKEESIGAGLLPLPSEKVSPRAATDHGKNARKELKETTYLDDDGFLVTEKSQIETTVVKSESEASTDSVPIIVKKEFIHHANDASEENKKQATKKKGTLPPAKQHNLFTFFSKS